METVLDIAWIAGAALLTLLATWLGTLALQHLYWNGTVGRGGFQVTLAGTAVIPPALAHSLCRLRGTRTFLLWLLWLPGLATYMAVPFRAGDGWQALGIWRFVRAWTRLLTSHPDALGVAEKTGMAAFAVVASACLLTAGGLWHGGLKWARHRSDGVVSAGSRRRRGEPGLPASVWASRRDVLKRFGAPAGIVLGELTDPETGSPGFRASDRSTWGRQGRGPLITMDPTDGNGHVLVTSQAAAYKTTGLVLPNILTYGDPLLVFDPKCEVYARTRRAREAMGFRPVVIDEESPFDPARLIAALSMEHPSAFRRMARMIIPDETGGVENGRFFREAAEGLLGAMLGYYAEIGSPNILGAIARLLAKDPQRIFETVKEDMSRTRWEFVRNQLRGLEGMDQRFFNSVKTGITNQLAFAEYPDVARFITMAADSPLVAAVLDPRTDIFLNVPQHVAEDYPALVRSILGSFLVAAQLVEQPEAPRARRLVLIDEAAKLGRMDTLADIRDRGRAIGLHLMMVYQTPGELVRIWGEAGATSWRDGCSAVVTGPVSSRTSATELSTMLGTKTIRVMTESRTSSNRVMAPVSGSVSRAEQEQLRDVPLLSPTEIAKLPRHAAVITAPGFRPILATKAIAFTRPDMASRVRSSEEIADELRVTGYREALLRRMKRRAAAGSGRQDGTAAGTGEDGRADVTAADMDADGTAEEEVATDGSEADIEEAIRPSSGAGVEAPDDTGRSPDDGEVPAGGDAPPGRRDGIPETTLDIDAVDIGGGFDPGSGLIDPDGLPEPEDAAGKGAENDERTGGGSAPVPATVPVGEPREDRKEETGAEATPAAGRARGGGAVEGPAIDGGPGAEGRGSDVEEADATPPGSARRWTGEEIDMLIRAASRGKGVGEIAALLRRPEAEILERADKLAASGVVRMKRLHENVDHA